jgi:hypothetical protein
MNTEKGFASILIILLALILIGGGTYFYTQKTSVDTVEPETVVDNPLSIVGEEVKNETVIKNDKPPTINYNETDTFKIIVPSNLNSQNNPFIGVNPTQSDFSVILDNGKKIKISVDKLEKLFLDMPKNNTVPADNWNTFYNLVKTPEEEYRGMPLPIKIKGYWLNSETFNAIEISWVIG